MHLTRALTALMATVLVSACASDRCLSRTEGGRGFKIPNLGSQTPADVEFARQLPPEVAAAVAAYFAGECHQTAVAARRYGSYVLLDVPTCAFDANRHLVYSPERGCIVGSFVWYTQG